MANAEEPEGTVDEPSVAPVEELPRPNAAEPEDDDAGSVRVTDSAGASIGGISEAAAFLATHRGAESSGEE